MQDILITFVELLYTALLVLILARVILSFTSVSPYHPLRRMVNDLTEPLLAPVRRFLPPAQGLDFSPLILLVIIYILRIFLVSLILSF